MGLYQCSRCFRKYTFKENLALKHVLVSEMNPYGGKTAMCKCGSRFYDDAWYVFSIVDKFYYVITFALELGHLGNGGSLFNIEEDYFYEGHIYDRDGKRIPFEPRYKTEKDAIEGHKLTVDNLHLILEHPERYPQSIITQFLKFMGMPVQKP